MVNRPRHSLQSIFWILLIGLMVSLNTQAATYATVSKNKVTRNELFQLQIITDQKASGDDVNFDKLTPDFFVNRPSFGTSTNIINGERSVRSEWDVSIAATRTGIVTIPSFEVNGEKTQPIAIQVVQDSTLPNDDDLIEIHSTLDKKTLYPDESTLLHVKMMVKVNPRRLQDTKITPPSVEGMDLAAASDSEQHREIINGLSVTVVQQTFRVTAQKPGRFIVTEPQFRSTLLYSGMNGETKVLTLSTTAKQFPIQVMAKPKDYQGVWLPTASLSLTQRWTDSQGKPISGSSATLKVGDSITRTLELKIKGVSQEKIPDLSINYPDSVRVYQEKPQYKMLDNDEIVMTLKQVLIPNQSGQIQLPGLSLNWWDTLKHRQRRAMLTGLTLNVAKGAPVDTVVSLPQTPTKAPEPPQEIQVRDPGIWPYLTALFALLWIVTTGCWLYYIWQTKRAAPAVDTPDSPTETKPLSLQEALKQQDGIRIQHLVQEQIAALGLSAEERAPIENEVSKLQASIYSSRQEAYDPKPLLRLLAAAEKQQKKDRKKQPKTLPDL
ncbi:BatD family protein [Vibrio rhizosphaerae]|uniref:BatD family protein n=1 Tax=Vibrio rhizosphaerae TaxID=398736 RepID=UPI00056DE3F1|nr:BatD family protein [Vibrio rhizosphaerae]